MPGCSRLPMRILPRIRNFYPRPFLGWDHRCSPKVDYQLFSVDPRSRTSWGRSHSAHHASGAARRRLAVRPSTLLGSGVRHPSHHRAIMTGGPGYHNRQPVLATNICSLLYSLSSSNYDRIAPKIEYWIEYTITEQFTTVDDLVERVSSVAWSASGSPPDISRFLREFRDAPHRSKGTKPFVDELCLHILRWFAVASTDAFPKYSYPDDGSVPIGRGEGFICAASFVGHLIECGLLSDELVRRHLVKPLTTHYFEENRYDPRTHYRTRAIYKLFTVAGSTLVQGLLEPEDVQTCFEIFDLRTWIKESSSQYLSPLPEFNKARFDVRCDSRLDISHCNLTGGPGTS